jgi:hypothetical protein
VSKRKRVSAPCADPVKVRRIAELDTLEETFDGCIDKFLTSFSGGLSKKKVRDVVTHSLLPP